MSDSSTLAMPHRWRWSAWTLLVLTLASGILLRVLWTGAIPPWFNSRFLLHAHSHVALLGWTFVGVFGFLLAGQNTPAWSEAGVLRKLAEGLILALILALFVAFLLQGYAFWSILLSTLHIGVTFALVGGYAFHARSRLSDDARAWTDLAILFLMVSSVGPLLLSGGSRMGQGWIDAWVGFYLTLTFNGWLTFAVLGLLAARGRLEPAPRLRGLMALGVLPTAVPPLTSWIDIPAADLVGWTGALLLGTGLLLLGARVVRRSEPSIPRRVLWASVGTAMILAGVLAMVGGAPPLAPGVARTRLLVVGYIHLQLLGFVSAALVGLLYPNAGKIAVGLFLTGAWVMILSLVGAGTLQLLGRPLLISLETTLAVCGLATLAGTLLLPVGHGSGPAREV